MAKKEKGKVKMVGRREWVDFPDLGLSGILAKVDTGAYTSALHVSQVEEIELDGKPGVRFYVLDPRHPEYLEHPLEFPVLKRKHIRSSSGRRQNRYIIKTRMKVGKKTYKVEFSLADRSKMECPVLLGRKFLSRKFLVDVSQAYLTTPNLQ